MTQPNTVESQLNKNGNGVNSLLKAFSPKQWIMIVVVLIALMQGNKAVNIPALFGIQTMGQTVTSVDTTKIDMVTLSRYQSDRQQDQFTKTLDSITINNKLDKILWKLGGRRNANDTNNGEIK